MGPGHYGVAPAFQQAAYTLDVIARMGLNHPGSGRTAFEPEMLKLGRLRAHRLRVRFYSGTMVIRTIPMRCRPHITGRRPAGGDRAGAAPDAGEMAATV